VDRTSLGVAVVRAPREILSEGIPALDEAARADGNGGGGVVLDLGGVDFVSSAGLGHLVRVGMDLRDRGARLALACPTKAVEKLLRVVGFDRVMPIFRDVGEAAQALRTPR
jgi:anti-anti-sigma factor